MGMFFGNSGETEAKRRTTIQAYDIAGRSYGAYRGNREQIAEQFTGNVSSAKARMGASGATMEGPAWQRILGGLVTGRDEALGKVQQEEETFKSSTAYTEVKQDFASMGMISTTRTGGGDYGGDVKRKTSYSAKSALTGESFLTDKQQGMLLTQGTSTNLREYASAIKPTWEEYEKFRFGTDKEKATYTESMTQRIEAANIKYKRAASLSWSQNSANQKFRQTDR